MKKLTILAIVAVLVALMLSACGTQPPTPAPTATVAPEVLASKAEDVIGVWLGRHYHSDIEIHVEYTKEGTFRRMVVSEIDKNRLSDQGKFWLEGTQLKLESAGGRCLTQKGEALTCIGTYQVYVTKEGDKPVKLRFVAVEDKDYDRRIFLRTLNKYHYKVEP
jgi:hypothetical protein